MMGRFTYEDEKADGQVLETYEWDNVWWEYAPDREKKRALIVGDSISCGYRDIVNKMLAGEIYVDGFGTSKALDNPFFEKSLDLMIAQSGCQMILFNNGLHGFHLDGDAYKRLYMQFVGKLIAKYPEIKFVILLTTPTLTDDLKQANEKRNAVVCVRNAAAREVAAKYGLDCIDLYELLADADVGLWKDPFHLQAEGYEKLARAVADYIRKNLREK